MQNFDQTHCNVIIGMQDFDQNPFQPTSIPYRRHHCKDMWILICNFIIFLFLFEAMQEKQQNLKTAERTFYSSSTIKRGASTPALQRPCSSQLPPDRPAAAKFAAKRPCSGRCGLQNGGGGLTAATPPPPFFVGCHPPSWHGRPPNHHKPGTTGPGIKLQRPCPLLNIFSSYL